MTTQHQVAREKFCHSKRIFQCRFLRGNRCHKCHVKVFLPANQCGVGSAKGEIGSVRAEKEGRGTELFFQCLIKILLIVGHSNVPKARTGGTG